MNQKVGERKFNYIIPRVSIKNIKDIIRNFAEFIYLSYAEIYMT